MDILQNRAFLDLRRHADRAGIDVNLVPADNRRKAILIADMDSTIITSESLDELAMLAGIGKQVAAITRRSMAGELDFETALDERVAMLAGKPKELIDQIIANSKLTDGARILVQTMRAHGAFCYLVSGGFDVLTGPIAAGCGFHGHHANHLDHDGTTITGTVRKPVLDAKPKSPTLHIIATSIILTLPPLPALAMGPMIWACSKRLALALPFTANQFYAKQWRCNSITQT